MKTRFALAVLFLLVGCKSVQRPDDPVLLLTDAQVWTGDPDKPAAESVAIVGSRIFAVGSNDEVRQILRDHHVSVWRIISLGGRHVVPGFIDAHVHILGGGLSLDRLDLSDARTREETLNLVARYALEHPDHAWILGRGWSYDAFKPGMPTRGDLDRILPDRPVYLRSYDGHSAWANSRALELAGIGESTPDPEDGTIVREKGVKRPSGALLEGAMELVGAKIPEPSVEEKRSAIRKALAEAASLGVTTLCEVGDSLEDLRVYRALDREGGLALRVVYGPSIDDGVDAFAKERVEMLKDASPGSALWPGPLKGFVDGVVESNTAAMLDPYSDGSGASAPPHLTRTKIEEQVARADKAGLDVAYHAIGDLAVRSVLDAIETVERKSPPRDRRFRIEHIEVVSPADVPRFASLGVIASMMPVHAEPGDDPSPDDVWSKKVGPEREKHAFAFAELEKAKAPLAFGSDWPVMSLDPLKGIGVATTRKNRGRKPSAGWHPEQRITVEDALRGYGPGAAWALRLENETGMIRRGFAGDLVVLGKGIRFSDPESFFDGQVELTIARGKIVFERSLAD